MDRNSCVDSAKDWIVKYECKNNIKDYKKRFGVYWLCTIKELQILDIRFDPRYMEKLKLSVKNCIIENGRLKEWNKQNLANKISSDSEENFACTAGYDIIQPNS